MTSRAARPVTAVRGAAAAGVATFAATVGHATAQGSAPSLWVVMVALALATPVCVALAGRRLPLLRLAVSVLVSQLGFHLLLLLDFTGPSTMPATGHHAAMAMSVAATAPSMSPDDMSGSMWLGHLLAAAATILVFATGERAVRALVALTRRPLRALRPLAALPVAPRALSVARATVVPRLVHLEGLGRRGPPVAA